MRDLGMRKSVQLHLDSTGALSLINKTGLSAVKHIEIQHLWLQQACKSQRLSCTKVHTDLNAADLMTKPLSSERIRYLMQQMGFQFVGRRSEGS